MTGVSAGVNAELKVAADNVSRAKVPEDVFGMLAGGPEERLRAAKATYHHLCKVVHPDKYAGVAAEADVARVAFMRLTQLLSEAEVKIQAGTYGDRKPVPTKVMGDTVPTVIQTPRRKYIVGGRIGTGDLCDVYSATFTEDGKDIPVAFKVAQSFEDNDLVEHEAKILKHLYPDDKADEKFYRYLCRLVDSFLMRGDSKRTRRVNVLHRLDEYHSVEDVHSRYPVLDFRDAVWIFKRVLVGIGFVHKQRVVHGAVLPPHIMISPLNHGAKLIDWSYAVDLRETDPKATDVVGAADPVNAWSRLMHKKPAADGPGPGCVKAISGPWRDFYAPEILEKRPVTPATDIYMAAKCMVYLVGGDPKTNVMPDTVPAPLRSFLASLLVANQARRPDNAWQDVHDELDGLLRRLVGPPSFRDFPPMPAKVI